jgi:hypothetical protein
MMTSLLEPVRQYAWSAGRVSVPRLDDLQELRELLSDEKP